MAHAKLMKALKKDDDDAPRQERLPRPSELPRAAVATDLLQERAQERASAERPASRWQRAVRGVVTQQTDDDGGQERRWGQAAFMMRFGPRDAQNRPAVSLHERRKQRRLRKGWQQYGVGDPWWVVHDSPKEWLPRYNSAPTLR